MKININHKCPDFKSYRAGCVKSLFNVDNGHYFSLNADIPIDDMDWQIGLVVGPSAKGFLKMSQAMAVIFERSRASAFWVRNRPFFRSRKQAP